MSAKSFQEIVGNALIDNDFRKALLNGSRRRILHTFELSGEEIEAIMAMRGDSLELLASDMHNWLLQAQGQHEIKPPAVLRHACPALDQSSARAPSRFVPVLD